jgi:hypothetical protein
MAFDPDAYLAQGGGFDPDAYLRKTQPASSNRWVQKIGEGLVPGFNRLTALGAAATDPLFGIGSNESFGQRYDRNLRAEQNQSQTTSREHPFISPLVQGVASVPAAVLTGGQSQGLSALTSAGRVANAAKTGAGFGSMYAAGDAPAGADAGGVLSTAAAGGAVGGLLGAGIQGTAETLPRLVPRLQAIAIDQGRKVLTGNTAPMATRKPLSPEAIDAAYHEKAIKPFGTVEKAAEVLANAREMKGDQYAQIVAALEAKGVDGPNAILLARQLTGEANQIASQSLGSPAPGMFRNAADELMTKVSDIPFASKRLGLTQAENMKRTLQRAAQSEYVKEGPQSLSGEARTELASRLRQAVEDSVAAQASKAPAEAAAFEPIKRELGAVIEASNAANKGAARAANRQTHGLGAKVMASGALASGGLGEAIPTLLGATALRNRGPATLGWTANRLASVLDVPPNQASALAPITGVVEADPIARLLAEAMTRWRVQPVPAAAGERDRR